MTALAWAFYNDYKKYIADNTMDIDGDTYVVQLLQSTSNADTATLTVESQLTNEVTGANGYVSGGITVASRTWNTGASASERRFDFADLSLSASGGTIPNIKWAVIYKKGASALVSQLMARSRLTTSQFTLADGNKLTLQINASGVFELN